MKYCGKCGRPLMDAISEKRGWDPDCWEIVREGFVIRSDGLCKSDFICRVINPEKPVVVIIDLDYGGRSVTNDIDQVIPEVASKISLEIYSMPIVYRDSTGKYDGIDARDPHHIQFYPIGTKELPIAVAIAVSKG